MRTVVGLFACLLFLQYVVMDGIDFGAVRRLTNLGAQEVVRLLNDDKDFRLTKSLTNLLYNIVSVGSVRVSRLQKEYFEQFTMPVLDLLSSKRSLLHKKKLLQRHPDLVFRIAESCPARV